MHKEVVHWIVLEFKLKDSVNSDLASFFDDRNLASHVAHPSRWSSVYDKRLNVRRRAIPESRATRLVQNSEKRMAQHAEQPSMQPAAIRTSLRHVKCAS